uniref:MLO protein homolog 1 n=1 Tax=Oryza sativa subsp. indica TaxID=39946 RepID=MLOH1_ORYSI|nr:RecName: Full=MLO protein homolog 1; AltName: Full=OsMLO1 [Oryza sativa Indica Group]CAB08606.2 Mlo1 protein [Oryza sativa Indica Group]
MAGGRSGSRELPETPTWAVAVVCAVLVLVSAAMEHGLHNLSHWFRRRQKKAMGDALDKIKAELMLLGFISLLLTVAQAPISKICIPKSAANILLPCKAGQDAIEEEAASGRRSLAGAGGGDYCSKFDGKVALMSAKSMHQLHIFIFVLAVFHVTYCIITMGLGRLKMKKWKKWESQTNSLEYQFAIDPSRFRFTHQTSFVKRHLGSFSSTPGLRWIVAFFRQFFGSVTKVDYLTMRQGFINAHLSQNSKFDFHKYIKRSLEDDFKVVVGISLPLWFVGILVLFLDIHGLGTLIWISFVPLIIVLLVGTKLEMVIMEMAQEIQDRATVIQGAPMVEPSNKYFWFNRPDWVLFFIHLTLFHNAFQMAHFVWTMATPGLKKCFHENIWLSIVEVIVGISLQVLCSYITFPLYALVTQMGSNMKKTIFEEQTMKALMNWRKKAMEKKKVRDADAFLAQMSVDFATPASSRSASPVHLLQDHRARSDDPPSPITVASPPAPEEDMYPVPAAAASRQLLDDPPDRRWMASSSADIADSDFSFSAQR